jgi:uncharacterized protein DUF6454
MRHVPKLIRRAALLALLLPALPASTALAGTSSLPAPPAAHGAEIAKLVSGLSRATTWTTVQKIPFGGNTYHPEGIVRLGDRYLVSAVEVTEPTQRYPDGAMIDGTDRTNGAGIGHLMEFGADGSRVADDALTAPGDPEYHPGGLDYDGHDVWTVLAQYRPNSTATFVRIDPQTREARPVLHADDHLGGVVHDPTQHRLVGLNWGARKALTFDLGTPEAGPLSTVTNPSQFVDYQDCKGLGRPEGYAHPIMLCGGLASYGTFQLGGIGLLDQETLEPLAEVPITQLSDAGNVLTRNPIDVAVVDGRLRLYLLPDDTSSVLYVLEAGPAA